MNILITHVYSSENKGDAALLSVLLNSMRREYPAAKILIQTIDKVKKNEEFEDTPVVPSLMYNALNTYRSRAVTLLYSLYLIVYTLFYAWFFKVTKRQLLIRSNTRESIMQFAEADLVLPVGGGYLRGKRGIGSTLSVMLLLHPLILSKLLSKPVILCSQSFGPFGNGFQQWCVAVVLRKMDLILVREEISLQLLSDMGVRKNVVHVADSGFVFESNKKIKISKLAKLHSNKPIVGITVRHWLDSKSQNKYEHSVASLSDHLVEKGYQIIFIPQVTSKHHNDDDRRVSSSVYKKMKSQESAYVITVQLDHFAIKSLYSQLDYMVGTRFHSVVFALTAYVPSLTIEYEHKTSGIMRELGLEEWVIKIEDTTANKLIRMFDQLTIERLAYIKHLKKVLPSYIRGADRATQLIKQTYEQSQNVTDDARRVQQK